MAANDIHTKCIDTIRVLAADVVQKSNSGHPGMPMGCAPVAHVLFTEHLNADPSHPAWINRDRFVLSNGHGCALQYIIMHLLGYAITMDDLKQFRQVGSKTPGHPEANHGIPGIEVTTGPLGQGISNAVGLAIAGQHMAATFNKPGYSLFDGKVFCFLGDGCMQEGVASEACSLAGHLGLGNLIAIYDDNHIQIDGDTELGFTEDVVARFKSYNWHTIVVADGDHDLAGISQAIAEAKKVTDKPTLIKVRTTIGFGSLKQGEEAVHGAALGDADVAQVKKKFGFDPEVKFHVDDAVYKHYHDVAARGRAAREAWQTQLERYSQSHPQEHAELSRRLAQKLPDGWAAKLPTVTAKDGAIATRKASEKVLNAICDVLPEIIGGSADLTPSTLTRWKSAVDFQKTGSKIGGPHGRYLRFGVREHGMMAICNGIHAYGGLIPFGSTFFNFISYGAGALRLSALTGHQVLYIMTHDSIGLGEDGPTHQPVETLAHMRALPNLLTFRPADTNEVSGAFKVALEDHHRPSVICLSRQNLPSFDGTSIENTAKGAYVLKDAEGGAPEVILVATGSEVGIAVETAAKLTDLRARVVSFPCWPLFEEQPLAYRTSVFPEGVPVLSIEAATTVGWERYAHACVGMTTFGTSGPYKDVYAKFGFTADVIAPKARKLVQFYRDQNRTPEWKVNHVQF